MASDNGRGIAERRRRERLEASLRENLKRRKAQERGRAGAAAVRPENGAAGQDGPPSLSEN